MSLFGRTATAPNLVVNIEKDVEVAEPPADSISSLSFSPTADFLAVGSWDNNVRMYEVGQNGQAQGKAMYTHQGPVLSVCWNKEGNKVISGGADNTARLFDLSTGQSQQVAQHDAPVKVVRWVETPQGGILATGSWDKTIKYWDLRTPNPVATAQLPERCYTIDVQYPFLVAGTAERHIQIFNLSNPTTPYKTIISPLKWQTRVISCCINSPSPCFAVGSLEGRVAIQFIEDKDSANNYSFRCHRRDQNPTAKDQSIIYAVNDISVNPVHGSVSTCGSDGVVNFWDIYGRTRLKTFDTAPGPISATGFNRNGTLFAYAVSYDWSKGHGGMTRDQPNKIMIHACKEEEVKRRPARK
ncbi:WD40 repeat-like protein [Hygrophoropsis aurantiaca]|uniref:WD40 repeat-like protein n=1 Tax=Hygrophoropsis aurantiaca TaxID=72124 RepID=A0ACB8ARV6_9AGAM|nr:WD40 repeat-like protein [Hygrophoropsis aurantiaca]